MLADIMAGAALRPFRSACTLIALLYSHRNGSVLQGKQREREREGEREMGANNSPDIVQHFRRWYIVHCRDGWETFNNPSAAGHLVASRMKLRT
jgi:hypothetical protein